MTERQTMETCINCIHCHKTKELINKEWKETYICTLWLDLKEKHEPLLLTIGERADRQGLDLCECIQLKNN